MIGGIFQSWLVLRRTNPRFSGLLLQTCECASRHCRGKTFVSPQETEPRVQKPPFNARDGESPFITYIHIYILFHVLVVSQQLDHRNSSIGLSSFSHYIHHYTSLYISMQRFHVFFPPDGPTTGAASTEPGQSCWQFEMTQRLTQLKAAVHMATVSRRCPSCSHWARCAIYGHWFFLAMLVSCGGFFWDKLRFRLIDISVGWDYTTYNWKLLEVGPVS